MSAEKSNRTARRVFFSGRVQGVGFRFTVCDVARRFDVAGFVRNLPDGRVELLCEGPPDETVRFIDAVYQAMTDYIREMNTTEESPTHEHTDFGIRY
jgi:acylphosphatase